MKVNLGIWDRLSRLIMILLIVAGLVGVALWYLPRIQEGQTKRLQVLQKEEELRREMARSNALKSQIEGFNDPENVERLARERLNYARSNEIVLRFPEATNPSPRELR